MRLAIPKIESSKVKAFLLFKFMLDEILLIEDFFEINGVENLRCFLYYRTYASALKLLPDQACRFRRSQIRRSLNLICHLAAVAESFEREFNAGRGADFEWTQG